MELCFVDKNNLFLLFVVVCVFKYGLKLTKEKLFGEMSLLVICILFHLLFIFFIMKSKGFIPFILMYYSYSCKTPGTP